MVGFIRLGFGGGCWWLLTMYWAVVWWFIDVGLLVVGQLVVGGVLLGFGGGLG